METIIGILIAAAIIYAVGSAANAAGEAAAKTGQAIKDAATSDTAREALGAFAEGYVEGTLERLKRGD